MCVIFLFERLVFPMSVLGWSNFGLRVGLKLTAPPPPFTPLPAWDDGVKDVIYRQTYQWPFLVTSDSGASGFFAVVTGSDMERVKERCFSVRLLDIVL